VLTVADKSFPLCLLDTNAVSEMINARTALSATSGLGH
jgi:hypothetical protein